MTKDEAQELIAEINSLHEHSCSNVCSGCTVTYPQIEKIISRFANKPPYDMDVNSAVIPYEEGYRYTCRVTENSFNKGQGALTLSNKDQGISVGLCIQELKQLRDNIDKMLEYLNDETT